MKKIKILSLFVCLIALLAACEDEDITPSYGARTVLVYIAGNNSLGQSDFDSKDVSEMIEGMNDPLRSKNYHDLMGLMKKIQENQQAFDNYAHAYQNAVVWKNTTDNNYCTYPSGYGEMVSMNGFEGLSTYILRGNDVKQDAYYRQSVEWYSAAGWADVYW